MEAGGGDCPDEAGRAVEADILRWRRASRPDRCRWRAPGCGPPWRWRSRARRCRCRDRARCAAFRGARRARSSRGSRPWCHGGRCRRPVPPRSRWRSRSAAAWPGRASHARRSARRGPASAPPASARPSRCRAALRSARQDRARNPSRSADIPLRRAPDRRARRRATPRGGLGASSTSMIASGKPSSSKTASSAA